jgi:NAD(P)-dependent dehydrogenase (short-subunit alcohol dehydrogenase family)
MRVMAIELAQHGIRANVVSPTNIGPRMVMNDVGAKVFALSRYPDRAQAMHHGTTRAGRSRAP